MYLLKISFIFLRDSLLGSVSGALLAGSSFSGQSYRIKKDERCSSQYLNVIANLCNMLYSSLAVEACSRILLQLCVCMCVCVWQRTAAVPMCYSKIMRLQLSYKAITSHPLSEGGGLTLV